MATNDGNGITRRDLLGLGGAAAGAALVGGLALPSSPAEAQKAPLPQVPRRPLGKTGKSVPILLLGGMALDRKFDPKIAEAVRFGVNYVDAADCYLGGNSEAGLAAYFARAKNRDQVWVTTKSDKHDPKGFEETVFRSLQNLQSDYVDLYYLHALKDPGHLNEDLAVTVSRLKKSGKIRHFGFSCHDGNVAELLHLAAKTPWVESVMFRYNFRSYGNKELNAAIDAAHKAGVGLIAMKTQGSEAGFSDAWRKFEKTGKWNKHQAVLKAVWQDERISAAVSHMDSFEKLRENIAAALDRTSLTASEREAPEDGPAEEPLDPWFGLAGSQGLLVWPPNQRSPMARAPRVSLAARTAPASVNRVKTVESTSIVWSLYGEAPQVVLYPLTARRSLAPHGIVVRNQ